MADQYINIRNIKFMVHEQFDIIGLTKYEYFKDYDEESFDLAIESAKQISDQYLFPIYEEMDKQKAYFEDGNVKVHPGLKPAIKAIADGGWISATFPYEIGGQQMPASLLSACNFIFYAANANAAAYAFLTRGATNLILNFGTENLKQQYIPQMYAGNWQGTMALTEPQAGSSLSDITTIAIPQDDGSYLVKGQKIYISGGDHEGVDNVVHLLLARIEGASAGTHGISLFVVPKYRQEKGKLLKNDVNTAGIFGKMGQKGYVAAHLMLGENEDCKGYLVGEENKGLSYMFRLMNEARIGTGLMATGTATAAYYAALQYTNERSQGRHPSSKDVNLPQVPIIEHADVRRMLLFQKAIVEGSLSLLIQCSHYEDIVQVGDEGARQKANLLLELLTPIAKSYPSEMGTLAVSMGMQCLGGAGYCDDFPLEQYYRDIRVNSIYEGTTGIHGLDLLGRKVMMEKGQAVQLFMLEIKTAITAVQGQPAIAPFAAPLGEAAKSLHRITLHLASLAASERPEVFLADATLYLEYFGIVAIGWQWILQAQKANAALQNELPQSEQNFYNGKLAAMQYFMEYEMPKTLGLHARLMSGNRVTLDTAPQSFC